MFNLVNKGSIVHALLSKQSKYCSCFTKVNKGSIVHVLT